MLVLAIDSSTKLGTVAIYKEGEGTKVEINLNISFNHSDTLMSSIDTLFKLSSYKKADIDKIAVSIGPGSFTGLRVGLATAKALAYSLNKPIIGVNTLDFIALNIPETNKKILSFIDARKGRVYWNEYIYQDGEIKTNGDYRDSEIQELLKEYENEEIIFAGDGSSVYKNMIKEIMGKNAFFSSLSFSTARASALAELACKKNVEDNIFTIEPYYISKSQAEQAKEKLIRGANL